VIPQTNPTAARRAKTDRIDAERLLRSLIAYLRGEPKVRSVVRVPIRRPKCAMWQRPLHRTSLGSLGVPGGPQCVVSPGPAPSTVFVVDKPQGLHCKTKVRLPGTRRMMVRSRIGWLHTGQRRSLSRRFMVAASRRGAAIRVHVRVRTEKAPSVLWATANCPAWWLGLSR
jgi:hypothetical protein